jgi:hypothetical protein
LSSAIVQSILLRFIDASVLLIEVEDVEGKEIWFQANVGNGFLHVLLNDPSPIDRPDFAHCSEQGIRHCDTKSLRLLRTKDGQNELYHPPLSIVSAIFGCGIRLSDNAPL